MMQAMTVLGAGFSGRMIARAALKRGVPTFGTTRSPDRFAELEKIGIAPLAFDGNAISAELSDALSLTSHLVISVAPPREEPENPADILADPFLSALGSITLREIAPKLEWVGYLSTVGVYGNHDGDWIDETAPLDPTSARSRQRVRAEAEWQEAAKHSAVPLSIFRLSGIYGPGRNALVSAEKGKARRLIKPGQVFNRIHVADIATAVNRAAEIRADGVFNITDDTPAPPQDVVLFAHELMGKNPPPEQDFDTADLTPMARSFYGDNKRVSNQRSKQVLEMAYAFPDYRTALRHMWENESWR